MSPFQVTRSSSASSLRCACPQARAMIFISSTLASKKLARRRADFSTSIRAVRLGFWVAMPTGQLLVWQARMPRQPIA